VNMRTGGQQLVAIRVATRLSQADGVFAGRNAVMLLKLRLINLHDIRWHVDDRLKRLQVQSGSDKLEHADDGCRPLHSGAASAKR